MNICLCTPKDIPALQAFIDRHWREGHILAASQDVLDWFYGEDSYYNFLIARRDDDIYAVLGFIDPSRFSDFPASSSEIWLALWKTREDAPVQGLGLRLLLDLKKRFPDRPVAVLGVSEDAVKMYRLLKFHLGVLDHLFIYNRGARNPKLLSGVVPAFSPRPFSGNVTLVGDPEILVEDARRIHDCRDRYVCYFINKYMSNPYYSYQFFRISAGGHLSYAVGRIDEAMGARALRLIDVFGQPALLGAALEWFERYLVETDCEYMDFYYHGEDADVLCDYGFINRTRCADDVIVPNYFAPYMAANIALGFAYETAFAGPIFKADGDQERPAREAL